MAPGLAAGFVTLFAAAFACGPEPFLVTDFAPAFAPRFAPAAGVPRLVSPSVASRRRSTPLSGLAPRRLEISRPAAIMICASCWSRESTRTLGPVSDRQ